MKKMQKGILMVALVMMLAVPFVVAHAVTPADLGIGQGTNFSAGQGADQLRLGSQTLPVTIARIINSALAILGVVAVVIIIAGGFMWMTAAGTEEKVKKAQSLIKSGIIGLAIILSAYAIATFVIQKLTEAVT